MTVKRESPFPFIIRSPRSAAGARLAAERRAPRTARKASISHTGGRFNYGGAGYRKARGNEANALQIPVRSSPRGVGRERSRRFYRPRRFEL